jgi:hypothetical protein
MSLGSLPNLPFPTGSTSDVLRGNMTFGAAPSTAVVTPAIPQGRLTTESGVPVSTSDRTAQSTLYWTPYNGNVVTLYDGADWSQLQSSEVSLALSGLTSDKNYDVFLYDNSGTLTIELSAAWTTDTARADALVLQDGIYVKSGATTRLHVGTIRTTGTTTTEDSVTKRFLWNRYWQARRFMRNAHETADSWIYTTATIRQANANAGNQLAYVTGDANSLIDAQVFAMYVNSTDTNAWALIGIDSTTVGSTIQIAGSVAHGKYGLTCPMYTGSPGLGYHFIAWLEYSAATGTTTWYGDIGEANQARQNGIHGWLLN